MRLICNILAWFGPRHGKVLIAPHEQMRRLWNFLKSFFVCDAVIIADPPDDPNWDA
jgi:hypothetical protein